MLKDSLHRQVRIFSVICLLNSYALSFASQPLPHSTPNTSPICFGREAIVSSLVFTPHNPYSLKVLKSGWVLLLAFGVLPHAVIQAQSKTSANPPAIVTPLDRFSNPSPLPASDNVDIPVSGSSPGAVVTPPIISPHLTKNDESLTIFSQLGLKNVHPAVPDERNPEWKTYREAFGSMVSVDPTMAKTPILFANFPLRGLGQSIFTTSVNGSDLVFALVVYVHDPDHNTYPVSIVLNTDVWTGHKTVNSPNGPTWIKPIFGKDVSDALFFVMAQQAHQVAHYSTYFGWAKFYGDQLAKLAEGRVIDRKILNGMVWNALWSAIEQKAADGEAISQLKQHLGLPPDTDTKDLALKIPWLEPYLDNQRRKIETDEELKREDIMRLLADGKPVSDDIRLGVPLILDKAVVQLSQPTNPRGVSSLHKPEVSSHLREAA